MFETLFTDPRTIGRHQSGPMSGERLRYLEHLKAQGTRRGTLRITARVLYRATLHMGLRESGPIQLKAIAKASEQWAFRNAPPERWRGPGGAGPQKLYYRTISRWLRFLGRLEEPAPKPSPHRAEVEAFMTYMQEERGLAPETLKTRRWHLGRFFAQCEGIALRRLSLSDVEQFLISLGKKGWTRVAIRSMCSSLRSFFLYAEMRHWTRPGVGAGIRKPRIYREEYLPQGPSWSHVEKLLERTNTKRPSDIRDRAILMLLAIYGLRRSEVHRLRLEDLDWERRLLLVRQSKQGRARVYPLIVSVAEAIARYLREVRPRSTHREVFLILRAPYTPIVPGSLYMVVASKLRHLGISLPHMGPHTLRHACATRLIGQGFTLTEVGGHLGHQTRDVTRIYAKVDVAGLREAGTLDLGGLL